MYLWQGLADVPGEWGRSVVTIGVFDGVHLGHQRIVARTVETAAERGLPVAVITFDPHPAEVIRPGSHPPYLCSLARRVDLLGELGVDAVCVLPFTREFSQLGPDEFVRAILADRLHAAAVVVGENFRFGHRAAGDVALLGELGQKYDFTVEGVPLIGGEAAFSSSTIRQKLAEGDVTGAADRLGRMHRVEGVIVPGHQRGRAMGFPTANLQTVPHAAIPADGVYAGWLVLEGEGPAEGHGRGTGQDGAPQQPADAGAGREPLGGQGSVDAGARREPLGGQGSVDAGAGQGYWRAAISVGTNPTFDGRERVVEAYALDTDDLDLYGARVGVDFAARLRDMRRFESAAELAAQMHEDVRQARGIVG